MCCFVTKYYTLKLTDSTVAPDQFVSSDVRLSGCCQGLSVIAMSFPAVWGGKGLCAHVHGELFFKLLERAVLFKINDTPLVS